MTSIKGVIRPSSDEKNIVVMLLDMLADVVSYIILKVAYIIMHILSFIILVSTKLTFRFVRITHAIYSRLGHCLPKSLRLAVNKLIIHTGLTRNPEQILGIVVIYSILLPAIITLIAFILNLPPIVILLACVLSFVLVWAIFYTLFILLIDKRASSVEKVLPDVLTMISQNMTAGMTTYNALWVAARPEFGPLAVEIQGVARETLSGESFEKALLGLSDRVKSYKLLRAVKLMVQGMRSGGELPTVLQEIAADIRTEQALFKRMSSDTTSQAMFILFALLIGAPLLLAASLQFVTIFNTIFTQAGLDAASTASAQIPMQKLPIEPEFFWNYAVILLGISGLCGALLIGMMRTGKLTSGVPLIFIVAPLAIVIFIVLAKLLGDFFKGMMGM